MKKLPILKMVGEALIIFLSVIGAFWVENYRESKNEKEDYIETLLGFRNAMYYDILRFRTDWDKTSPEDPNFNTPDIPIWIEIDSALNVADSILDDKNKTNDTIAFQILLNSNYSSMTDYRFETPYLSQLKEFPRYLRTDTLEDIVSLYIHHMKLEFTPAEAYNKTYYELLSKLKEGLNFNQIKVSDISQNVNLIHVKNTVVILRNQCHVAMVTDRFVARRLTQYVKSIDNVLAIHNVDTSRLEKNWFIE